MTRHVVRVTYQGGIVEVDDAGSGTARTHRVDAGNIKTRASAIEVGTAALAQYAYSPRESISAKVNDTDFWPDTGDAVDTYTAAGALDTHRLITRRVVTTPNGKALLNPTLNSPSELFEAGQAAKVRRLANGDFGGRFRAGRGLNLPESNVLNGSLSAPSVPPWSFTPVDEVAGPPWEAEEYLTITKATIQLRQNFGDPPVATSLTGNMTIKFYVDNFTITFYQVLAGVSDYSVLGSINISPGQTLVVSVDAIDPAVTYDELDLVNMTVEFDCAPGLLERREERR